MPRRLEAMKKPNTVNLENTTQPISAVSPAFVRIPPGLLADIDQAAARARVSRKDIVHRALAEWLRMQKTGMPDQT